MDDNIALLSPKVSLNITLSAKTQEFKDAITAVLRSHNDSQELVSFSQPNIPLNSENGTEQLKQRRMSEVGSNMIYTPSVSVMLFILDPQPNMPEFDCSRQTFGTLPWRFHHASELNSSTGSRQKFYARQEHYELSKDLPLFTISSVHYGEKFVRFNIFTYNHKSMVDFYRKLLKMEPFIVRDDFCYFEFTHKNKMKIQLGLKHSRSIMPYPCDNIVFMLGVDELPLDKQYKQLDEYSITSKDPDFNSFIMRKTIPLREELAGQKEINVENSKKLHEFLSLKCEKEILVVRENRPDVIPSIESLHHSKSVATKSMILECHPTCILEKPFAKLSLVPNQLDLVNHTPEDNKKSKESDSKKRLCRESVDIIASF